VESQVNKEASTSMTNENSLATTDGSTCSTVSTSSQTTQQLSVNTPRKKKLKTEVSQLKAKCAKLEKQVEALSVKVAESINSVDHFKEMCDVHLPPNLSMIIVNFVNLTKKNPHGYRYTNEIKQLALTIYFFGPRAYTFLKTIFQLPTIRTLRRVTEKYEIVSGLNDILFEYITFKANNLSEESKDCVLCIDEMAIKSNLYYNISKDFIVGFNETFSQKTYEPAKHALCFMIRGLKFPWKQPIAYFFVHNSCTGFALQNTIFAVINRLQSTPLNIRVLTTDQGSNFYAFAKSVNVSKERPFFSVNNKKIYYIFDTPHLLKSTRNNFFKHKFIYNDNVTNKKYLDTFYANDKGINRLAPKLTDIHLNPGPFQKMKVKYATHIFSATVAAGMKCHITSGYLPQSATFTIKFIEYMDQLFDLLNSKLKGGSKNFNRPFKNTEEQNKHLLFMLTIFNNLIVKNNNNENITSRMKFISGWQITISAVLQLWEDIKETHTLLFTNRLNQDCLENLFGNFRQQNGNNQNPTPIQFIWSFKKVFFTNYFRHSDGANCIDDLDIILTKIGDSIPFNSKILFPETTPFKFCSLSVGTVDYRDLNVPPRNALTYVSGYLLSKCLQKHTCDVCLKFAKIQDKLDESFLFNYFKSYSNKEKTTFGNLLMPPDIFYNYINQLDSIFIVNFPILAVENNVGIKLKNFIDNVPFNHPCPNFNIEYLKLLYIRFRIFYAIKTLNQNLLSVPRKNKKLTILSHL